jgi:hypothetical protein
MNLKSCHSTLLATVFFALLAPLSALAQEDKGSFDSENPTKESIKHDQDTPSGTENPDPRSNKNMPASTQQDPVSLRDPEIKSTKPVTKAIEKLHKEDEKVQKEEEDPLSFNFLYYIIEKFKLSDIVE